MTNEFAAAVHAMLLLYFRSGCQKSDALAKGACTNPARMRMIVAKLKKAGLVETREGAEGGCFFLKSPEKVTLEQICRAVGSVPVSVPRRNGDYDRDCMVASGMAELMDGLYTRMNDACYSLLGGMTLADLTERILKSSSGQVVPCGGKTEKRPDLF